MELFFLEASVPLTKIISPTDKIPYPDVAYFSSSKELITNPLELYRAIEKHAKANHCLLKGRLHRDLINERRKGTTRTDDATEWICLDFDRMETPTVDDALAVLGLNDVSYVLQYSSSHGLPGTEGTISAHVFMLLDKPVEAPLLKAWLMNQNLTLFRDELRLSRDKNRLCWPLDVSTCQNDKLLYIAPPIFKGMKDPLSGRIQFVKRKKDFLPTTRLGERHIDAIKEDEKTVLNLLRKAEGLKPRLRNNVMHGEHELVVNPSSVRVTGIKDCDEYVRLNIEGGDSWAYWHPRDNFDFIYSFKDEGVKYKTKEYAPGYYKDCVADREAVNATPTDEGDLILGFCDKFTHDYYNGIWNPESKNLELYQAKNEKQVHHWMKSHGRSCGDFPPFWELHYNPREEWQVDEDNHRINTFVGSSYMRCKPAKNTNWPTILTAICHMLGEQERSELVDHFINWFACVFQRKHKPLTAWVLHGVEGTGKGFFFNKIATPLLHHANTSSVRIDSIEDQFNGFLENKLLVLIDEVDVDDFREKGRVSARMRNYITEPTISVRAMRRLARDVPNYCSFLFSSNRPQPVYIPETDRRYNVGNFQSQKMSRPDEKKIASELEAFAQHLLTHKVDLEAANTPLQTEERSRIQRLAITSVAETCRLVLDGDIGALWMARTDERLLRESGVNNPVTANAQAYNFLMETLLEEATASGDHKAGKLTRDELLIILQYNVGNVPSSPNKFTSFLRHNGIEIKRIRKNGNLCYGLELTWKVEPWLQEELESKKPTQRVRRVK